MIELDEFIAGALSSIVSGIRKGQATDVGDHVAPRIQGKRRNEHGNFVVKDDTTRQATIVQFDVQVASESQKEGAASSKAKFRLFVVDAELGGDGKVVSNSSNLHRLQFAVPVMIPRLEDGSA